MALQRLMSSLGWPALGGGLVALTALLLLPQLRHGTPTPQTQSSAPTYQQLPHGPASYAAAVQLAAPAVVNIYTRQQQPQRRRHPLFDDPLFRHFFNRSNQPRQERMQSTLGSGVIIDSSGYLLTNEHVISKATEIVVLLHDGREAHATVVGRDPDTDLAVLKIELDQLTAINVGQPRSAQVGDVVLAIGNPFGVGQTVTQGIISATRRHGLGINTYENFLQTDAAINPGNSGGALIDAHGNLLGINTAILDKTGYSVGIGFAIPADTATRIMRDIINYGQVVRGWLGIEAQQLSPQLIQSLNSDLQEGVIITAIYNNGPAYRAGLRPGDIITQINGENVGSGQYTMTQVAQTQPGTKVSISFIRDNQQATLEVTIGTRPKKSR